MAEFNFLQGARLRCLEISQTNANFQLFLNKQPQKGSSQALLSLGLAPSVRWPSEFVPPLPTPFYNLPNTLGFGEVKTGLESSDLRQVSEGVQSKSP